MSKKVKEKSIEQEIAEVFKKLIKTKYNASFAYSFVYTNTKDMKTAAVEGRLNIHGSLEEVEVHIDSIIDLVAQQEKKFNKKYANRKDKTRTDRPQKGI